MREDDFDTFYRETVSRVVHLVYACTGDLELARDATQDAYAKAWQRWDKVSQSDDPLSWVRTVARRDAISSWRKSTNRDRALVRHGPPPDAAAPTEDRVAVVAALRTLTPEMREAVALHYLADMPVAEIARTTGAPAGTVKARLSRGRAQLAAALADTGGTS